MEPSKSPVVQKSFLTPCRRLGLARRSPVSSGGLQKMAVALTRSVESSPGFKSPEPRHSTSQTATSDSPSPFMKTPSRSGLSRLPSKNLYKRLKSNPPDEPQSSSVTTLGEIENGAKAEGQRGHRSPKREDCVEVEYEVKDGKLNSQEITAEMIEEVKARIKEKEEKLRHLQQMRIYRKKHDPAVLKKLIECWREGCQKAVNALAAELRERGYSITIGELLRQFRIPFELVRYNADEEDFE